MRSNCSRWRQGSALLTVVILTAVILSVSLALLAYTGKERNRAINLARAVPRNYCAETGLQLARTYFGKHYPWDTYLADPADYDPVPANWMAVHAPVLTPATPYFDGGGLATAHPELFADLDGDGNYDVYIYIRNNNEEPASPERDNDLQVIVGAVCISSTLSPRLPNGRLDSSELSTQGLLAYTGAGSKIAQRCGAGGASLGNCNAN